MSYNYDFAAAQAVQTVLQGLDPCPDIVQIVPAGAEKDIPDEAKSLWINVSVKNTGLVYETSNSFVGTSILNVTIGARSNKKLSDVTESITSAATDSLITLSKSSLGGYARRAPTDVTPDGYSGGEGADAIFWFSMTFGVEHQVNE